MAEKMTCILQQQTKPIKILKWKVKEGTWAAIGRVILLYEYDGDSKKEQYKLKLTQAGTIHKIVAPEDTIVPPGEVLCEITPCIHPTIMNDMCAECGADLRTDDSTVTVASVPMVHAIPALKVSEELAQKLGKADCERLIKDRKLVLLVDLDQTLIHTTNDNIPPNVKDVYHFQLYGPNSPWYHTRLRPGTHRFLNNVYPYFELHICTFGARNYAHTIAAFLDPDQKLFSNRILSRDECFDPTSKKANLNALFPCGDHMVCIIDDREDVWSHASNLIHVKPYHFFQHTGDINAPPGLEKHEDDNKVGVDLTKHLLTVFTMNQLLKNNNCVNSINDKENNDTVEEVEPEEFEDDKIIEEVDNEDEKNEIEEINNKEEEKTNEKNEEVKVNGKITINDNIQSNEEKEEDKKENIENKNETLKENITEEVENNKSEQLKENLEEPVEEKKKEDILNDKNEEIKKDVDIKEAAIDSQETESKIEQVPKKNDEKKPSVQQENKPQSQDLIEIDDPDDYLIYLEDILKRIHKAFYEEFDKIGNSEVPDLKKVIPTVRSKVLKGCKLVFSGLVPTHIKLELSKAYQIAKSLGAEVTQNIEEDTTHLVAVRPGTAKVNAGRRKKNLKIVTPDWLWCCAERWEHVEEKIFPLSSKGSKNRHPPPHCSSPEHNVTYPEHNTPAARKRTPSGRFMDTINPLMSFSSDDIADMDKEVEDILDDESDTTEDEEDVPPQVKDIAIELLKEKEEDVSSSSDESLTGEHRGHKRKRKTEENNTDAATEDDEVPSIKFRRGESVDEELDVEPSSSEDSERSLDAPDEVTDGEWNMMGAALEREFLSNN